MITIKHKEPDAALQRLADNCAEALANLPSDPEVLDDTRQTTAAQIATMQSVGASQSVAMLKVLLAGIERQRSVLFVSSGPVQ